ncbi:hypothetical protein [Heliothis virescens ascovirus 3g]|uniref:Uncharacterized protein n=1 Tax=Heliothis virescens ascovirus 3g TaxID=1246651 RepID=K4NVL1_9VIRU|nr:hypothetical protein F8204_gp089 [Heliothis virescens ascovirus 3g]AFV50341.1 hypothetical protein [Heliothis virescens ascovirus 3g]
MAYYKTNPELNDIERSTYEKFPFWFERSPNCALVFTRRNEPMSYLAVGSAQFIDREMRRMGAVRQLSERVPVSNTVEFVIVILKYSKDFVRDRVAHDSSGLNYIITFDSSATEKMLQLFDLVVYA